MNWITFLGILAACLTTFSSLPQLIKSFKTKHTEDLSLGMYILSSTGVLLWLIYGLTIKDTPLIFANSVGFVIISSILILKLKYG
jgi:MtN3 and saliva related transmembrane protein